MQSWAVIVGGVSFLYLCGFFYWRILLRTKSRIVPPVLLFHKVEPISEWGVTSLKPGKFTGLISHLNDLVYSSVTPDEAFKLAPDDWSKKVLITFDDAYSGVYDCAWPILERFGFSATVL